MEMNSSLLNASLHGMPFVSLGLLDVARFLTQYVQPIIIITGIAGNGLSLIIFLSKDLRKVSSNVYLGVLSASCSVFLTALLVVWMEVLHVRWIHQNVWCQSIVFITYVSSFLTVWSVVCITVENYIVTFHLRKATYFCTVPKAKIVSSVLTTIAVVMYAFSLWTTKIEDYMGTKVCTSGAQYQNITTIFTFIDTIVTLIMPTAILVVLISAILAKHVWQRRIKSTAEDQNGRKRLSRKEKSLLKITRVLLAIGVTYVVLGGPSYINKIRFMFFVSAAKVTVDINDRLITQIVQNIFYLTFCFNFVFYAMWSLNFRRGLQKVCRCGCKLQTDFQQAFRGFTRVKNGQTSNTTDKTAGQHITITSL